MRPKTNDIIRKALETFVFQSCVPIFKAIEHGDADHLATGIFIRSQNKLFLLTARHILEGCNPENIAIARSPTGSQLLTLGISDLYKPVDCHYIDTDIVCIEIKEPNVIKIVKEGWRTVDVSIGMDPKPDATTLLVGYPSATLAKNGMTLRGKPTSFITSVMDEVPKQASQPVKPELDLFLVLKNKSVSLSGEHFDSPAIRGMSGCAIWQFSELQDTKLWVPDQALRLVGIQSSALSAQFFRGKRWAYIRYVIDQACLPT